MKKFTTATTDIKKRRILQGSFGRLLSLGIPMGLQFSITAIGTIIVQSAVNI